MPFFFFFLMIFFIFPLIYYVLQGNIALVALFKSLCSFSFVLCSISCYKKKTANKKYFFFLLTSLILYMIGDILLAIPNSITYILGAVSFTIGHIILCIAFTKISPLNYLDIILFSILFIPSILFISLNRDFNYHGLYPFVFIYSSIITFMYTKALSLYKFKNSNRKGVFLTIISTSLFYISDFILLFILFNSKISINLKPLNLFIYYIGQGLLGLSLLNPFINRIDELVKIKDVA